MKTIDNGNVITFKRSLMLTSVAAATLIAFSTSAFASDTDDRIESSFKKSFVYKTYLKDENIKITSKDGIVTLSGDVLYDAHKPMAQDTAEALPGVKSVDNKIIVKEEKSSDGWLRTKVQTALVFHSNVSATKTEVSVKSGVVTLKGEAASQARKDLTTQYAQQVEGVKSVVNQMKIAKPTSSMAEKIDDASITAQVKMILLAHRSTGVLRTTVTTKDGIVTLGGIARSEAEIDLATKLAEDIEGVDHVYNTMTVDDIKKN